MIEGEAKGSDLQRLLCVVDQQAAEQIRKTGSTGALAEEIDVLTRMLGQSETMDERVKLARQIVEKGDKLQAAEAAAGGIEATRDAITVNLTELAENLEKLGFPRENIDAGLGLFAEALAESLVNNVVSQPMVEPAEEERLNIQAMVKNEGVRSELVKAMERPGAMYMLGSWLQSSKQALQDDLQITPSLVTDIDKLNGTLENLGKMVDELNSDKSEEEITNECKWNREALTYLLTFEGGSSQDKKRDKVIGEIANPIIKVIKAIKSEVAASGNGDRVVRYNLLVNKINGSERGYTLQHNSDTHCFDVEML